MRSIIAAFSTVCLAVTLLASWSVAQAQDAKPATPSGQYKIGVVNRKAVLEGYKKVKAEYEKLQGEVESRQTKIDELSKKIEDAKKTYEAEKEKLSAGERADKEVSIQNDFRQYQTMLQSNQAEIDTKEKTLMKGVFAEIDEVVAKFGADGNYHLIMEGGARSNGAIYFSPTIDVSQQIADALNAKAGSAPEAAKASDKPASKSDKSKN